jgi:hypothetical protein
MHYLLKTIFSTVLLSGSLFSYSQETPPIVREQWKNNPEIHTIPAEYAKEPAIIVYDFRRVEFIDVKDELVEFKTLHKIVHLNDDRGIEAFNKIYLPVTENKSIVDMKARTILPGGRTIELSINDIKEVKEDDRLYKIFALEGLVKGCDIEFLYTYNTNVSYFGREVLQGGFYVMESHVDVISPDRLVFEAKGFNGVNAATDTTINVKRFVSVAQQNIRGAEEEKYSMYTGNLKRLEYRLSYNKAKSTTERLFTWNTLAKTMFNLNGEYSDKELKKMNSLVDDQGWKKMAGEKEKVIAVENYMKKNFALRDDISSDDAENIEWILKTKICSERGMMRLFGSAFSILGVTYEFVLCGSRNEFTIDKNFENWINCNNTIIYFPALQKYISPASRDTRFPWIDPYYGASNGIFCKQTTIGNFTTAIAYQKQILLEDCDQSQTNIEADLKLNATLDTLLIDGKQIDMGYLSVNLRRAFNFNSDEDKKLIIKQIGKHSFGTDRIPFSEVENADFEMQTTNKPVILHLKVESSDMVEKAGNKILVKIGEIIGPQVEMYQEKNRQFPIELPFGHILDRKITLAVPQGYRIKNLQDLNMKNVYQDNNEKTMGFESTSEVTGNSVVVHIREEYRKTFYPLDQYEAFRKIINMAADFNKVVLVFEKI